MVGRQVNPNAVPFHVPPLIHRTESERIACQLKGGCERDTYPSGDTLDRVIKTNNPRAWARPYPLDHPLRRRIVCPCGWRMGFRRKRWKGNDKDYGYLFCARTTQRGKSVVADYPNCPVSGISTLTLWPRVRELFVDAIRNPDRVVAEVQSQIRAEAERSNGLATEATELQRVTLTLANLDAQENRLYERWDAGDISKHVHKTQTMRIASKRQVAEEQKRRLLSHVAVFQRAERATTSIRQGLANAASEIAMDQLTLASWSRMLDSLVSDIVLDERGEPSIRWHAMPLKCRRPGERN